jgi:hypothetical protein
MYGVKMPKVQLPNKWMPNLEPISLDISEIKYDCSVWKIPKTQLIAGYIKFTGTYKPGSLGMDDARFIQWRIDEFAECQTLHGLTVRAIIIDFRNLEYTWGNDLTAIPSYTHRMGHPFCFLIPFASENKKVHEAYMGALNQAFIQTNIYEAFKYIVDAISEK